MSRRRCRLAFFALLPAFALGMGCGGASDESPAAPPPVTVSVPLLRPVTEYADFTGRTAAKESVEVRARVYGFLDKVNFKEGADVKKGDVLFEIDPSTYKADLDKIKELAKSYQATLTRAEADINREATLLAQKAGTRADYDKALGARDEAAAQLRAAQASIFRSKIDLDYCKVTAPISGRISKAEVTEGNLVQAGQNAGGGTLLTTIVSLDPMYGYFDVDENTFLRVRERARNGQAEQPRPGEIPVFLGLSTEKGYPHKGTVDFVDNQVNAGTGTIRVRGVFPNKDGALTPGLFARFRVKLGDPKDVLLVTERALMSDQGQKFLLLVNDKNDVVARPVEVGPLNDGLRVISAGLQPTDKVIVDGITRVRPGVTVTPKLVDMPERPGLKQKAEGRKQKAEGSGLKGK